MSDQAGAVKATSRFTSKWLDGKPSCSCVTPVFAIADGHRGSYASGSPLDTVLVMAGKPNLYGFVYECNKYSSQLQERRIPYTTGGIL
jgi:hypothetical protein